MGKSYISSDNVLFLEVGCNAYDRPPDVMPRPHRHDEMEFVLMNRGKCTYLFGDQMREMPVKTLAIFWAGMPHQVVKASSTANLIGLEIPLPWYLDWKLPDGLTQNLLQGRVFFDSNPDNAALDEAMLKRWNADLKSGKEARKRSLMLEAEARLWRLLEENPEMGKLSRAGRETSLDVGDGSLGRIDKMVRYIAKNYQGNIRADDLAKEIGLSTNFAMKLFHKSFGCNLTDYINQYRVAHAKRMLSTTNAKVTAIAMESGFGSISRFNFVFNELCGCSPRDFRRANKAS